LAAPDRARLEEAVRAFLTAAGLDLRHADLVGTPERVAAAWVDEFLAGYAVDAKSALGELVPTSGEGSGLVVVTDLEFRSMCPHHLLPYRGVAHLAYLPSTHLVGFGRLAALVDALGHRLVLQEHLARQIAQALIDVVGARGAGCLIRGEHMCLQLRGEEQTEAVVHAEAFLGVLASDAAAQAHVRHLANNSRSKA
jgi:GTP cyclohydrolase I